MSDVVPTTCTTGDGLTLEAELVVAEETRALQRCCAILTRSSVGRCARSSSARCSTPFRAGVTCLRFNFRGVEGSDGFHDGGRGEQLDVVAAIDTLDGQVDPALPMLLAGWSFGADLALATVVDRVAGWFAVAPPLRSAPDFSAVARDLRPKLLALAEHDEVRPPQSVADETGTWAATTIEVVGGASHYFVGRTDRLVALAVPFVDRVSSATA